MNNYNRTTTNYTDINIGSDTNNNANNYYCIKCNFQTDKCHIYDKHLESIRHKSCKQRCKSDMKKYKCENCEYENYNKNKYLNHLLNKHYTTAERIDKCNFYCRSCDVAVPVDTMLDSHFKSKTHLFNIYDFTPHNSAPQTQPIYKEYIYEINNGIPPPR
jgi:hypothetical protein